MARGRARTDVELVDDDGDDAPGAPVEPPVPDPAGRTGRHDRGRRRALVVAAVVVVVLAVVATVGQVRQAAAERQRLARVAALPNTVASLETPPRVLWSTDGSVLQRIATRTPDGLLVGARDDEDGSSNAQALDPATGDVVWERDLLPPATYPDDWSPVGSWCVPSGDDGTRVACYASDATYRIDGTGVQYEPPTTVRLLLLDARDGSLLVDASDAVPGDGTRVVFDAFGDLVVLAQVVDEEAQVVAVGADGRVAWRTTVPAPTPLPSGNGRTEPFADVVVLGEHLLVATADTAHLLDRTGATLRTFPMGRDDNVNGVVGGVALVRTGPARTELERVDGEVVVHAESTRVLGLDGEHVLRGALVQVDVDDATAPGLVLTRDHEGLQAWGLDGEPRWTARLEGQVLGAAVLDGRVLVVASRAVVALDARTGAELWQHEEVEEQTVVTDGRRLLVTAEAEATGQRDLLALDATDGGVVWRAPAPPDLQLLRGLHGTLLAESYGWEDETWSMTVLG